MPHVKKNGFWDIQNSYDNNEVDNIKDGEELLFIIKKNKKLINLEVYKDDNAVLSLDYLLPSNFASLPSLATKEGREVPLHTSLKNDFPKGGKIGFRAYGNEEKVVITELKIEKNKK